MLDVYVPAEGSVLHAQIAAGSGVVGTRGPGGKVVVDFEGNRYGAAGLQRFADRVHLAADRQREGYPTRARMGVEESEVERVGEYDLRLGRVTLERSEVVARWLGVEAVEEEELETTSVLHRQRRELERLEGSSEPADRERSRWLRREMNRREPPKGRGRSAVEGLLSAGVRPAYSVGERFPSRCFPPAILFPMSSDHSDVSTPEDEASGTSGFSSTTFSSTTGMKSALFALVGLVFSIGGLAVGGFFRVLLGLIGMLLFVAAAESLLGNIFTGSPGQGGDGGSGDGEGTSADFNVRDHLMPD